jgi:hypothetical protein
MRIHKSGVPLSASDQLLLVLACAAAQFGWRALLSIA